MSSPWQWLRERPESRQLKHALSNPVRWARDRASARGLILMYHGVADVAADPWGLFVSPDNFADHLACLRSLTRPMRLGDLAAAHARGELPDGAVSVTFDDGYANNLTTALPYLERFDVPATVFAVAGTDDSREFWWDELEQLVLGPSAKPQGSLRLQRAQGSYQTFEAPEHPSHSAERKQVAAQRALYQDLWEHLLQSSAADRDEALARIAAWSGVTPRLRPTHRRLTVEEVRELDRHPLIDIGGHTLNHPMLPRLCPADQVAEIGAGSAELARRLGHPVDLFAYPFGAHAAETLEAARRAGHDVALAAEPFAVAASSNSLRLPRIDVKDWSLRGFERRVRYWKRWI